MLFDGDEEGLNRGQQWSTAKDYKALIELQKGGRRNVCMRDFLANHM
jgi:hypothetical protein